MRQPSKDTWVGFAVLLAIFWLLPLASIAISQWTGDMFSIIILLFLVFPLVTLAISFLDGRRHGLGWWWIPVPFLCFLSIMFVYFNDSAFIYCVAYALTGAVGTGLGALFAPREPRRF